MATISKGIKKGLTVLNNVDGGVNLPVNAEEVIQRQTDLEVYLKNFVRTGGLGKLQRDGRIYYSIFAKANLDREITVTSDGKVITDGMYNAETDSNFGYVKPTTIKAYEDSIELTGGKFMKEIITQRELEQENLPTLASDRISTYQAGNEEQIIYDIKSAIVLGIGTTGKAATDAGWTPTNTRKLLKDYTIDETGGLDIYKDIDEAIGHSINIGRKGSVEEAYPFARGRGTQDQTLLISRNSNRALTIAFKESPSGTLPGLLVDQKAGLITSLFGITTIVTDAMPDAAANSEFHWAVITKGKNGAIAMPSVFDLKFTIRPHFEGVSTLANIIEGEGGSWGIKLMQPELMFGAFGDPASPGSPTGFSVKTFKGNVMSVTADQRKALKTELGLAGNASNDDLQKAVDAR